MARRRANGEGVLRQRADGKWEARLTHIDPDTGRRQTLSFYATTAKEAAAKRKNAKERLDAGAPPRDATRTVGDWLAHWRITTLAASDRKQSTRDLYATLCRTHLEPEPFGATRLDRLRPSDIEALILWLRRRSLSDSTVRSIYTVLRSALDGAVRDQLMARNPAASVRRPGVQRREARYLTGADVVAVLKEAETSRYYPPLALIASTGLRRGEVLGLTWERVDLEAGTLRVVATLNRVGNRLVLSEPKTDRARRNVPISPEMVAMLKKHRIAQKEERLKAGNQWHHSDLVFTTEFGTPVEPRNLLRVIESAAAKAELDDVDVHTLRHSAAMAWLEGGVHIKAVADLLGHSSVAITGDVYGHSTDDIARGAVDFLSKSLGL